MAQSIITVGFEIPGHSDKHVWFTDNNSLLDHDVIIFNPDISSYCVGADHFQGKQSLSEHSSFQLKQQIAKWKTELTNAFNHGKTVFIIMHQPQVVFVDSGRRAYTGTGRNQKTTTYVDELSSYSLFPFGFEELVASNGKEIRPTGALGILANFWTEFSDYCSYEVYFSSVKITPVLSTKTGKKTVGGVFQGEKNSKKGAFVLLPKISFEREKFTYKKGDSSYWNKEGVAWGSRLITCILEIDRALRAASTATPVPSWTKSDQYRLASERATEAQIVAITEKISALEVEKEKLSQQLTKDSELRRLLFETGTELEAAILEGLQALGLKPSRFRDSQSEFDVIFEWNENRFLGEAEGKDNKAINVDKISQLERNLNEDFAKDDVRDYAKGILFGNAFRLEEPSKRGDFFTEKCLSSAARLKAALVRTPDLFQAAKYIKESGDTVFAEKCIQAILGASGTVVVFPSIPLTPEAQKTALDKA